MVRRWGKREIIILYLSLHCHHQNDSCIEMGSDESHFIVSLIVRDKGTRQCPQTTTFLTEEKGEPKRNRAEAFLLTSLGPYRWAKPVRFVRLQTNPIFSCPATGISLCLSPCNCFFLLFALSLSLCPPKPLLQVAGNKSCRMEFVITD